MFFHSFIKRCEYCFASNKPTADERKGGTE
jgi:hypothetical protein